MEKPDYFYRHSMYHYVNYLDCLFLYPNIPEPSHSSFK